MQCIVDMRMFQFDGRADITGNQFIHCCPFDPSTTNSWLSFSVTPLDSFSKFHSRFHGAGIDFEE